MWFFCWALAQSGSSSSSGRLISTDRTQPPSVRLSLPHPTIGVVVLNGLGGVIEPFDGLEEWIEYTTTKKGWEVIEAVRLRFVSSVPTNFRPREKERKRGWHLLLDNYTYNPRGNRAVGAAAAAAAGPSICPSAKTSMMKYDDELWRPRQKKLPKQKRGSTHVYRKYPSSACLLLV